MLKKLKKAIDSFKYWVGYYPPELKEMHRKALEANKVYESAIKKARPAVKKKPSANKAVWHKDFKVEDVKKALDQQAPKPKKEKTVATKPGLYSNIHAKQARIAKQKAEGKPVETMRKPGTKGAPTAKAFKESAKTAKKEK